MLVYVQLYIIYRNTALKIDTVCKNQFLELHTNETANNYNSLLAFVFTGLAQWCHIAIDP